MFTPRSLCIYSALLNIFTLQCVGNFYCTTPIITTGIKMNITNCQPLNWLTSRYGSALPKNEAVFFNRSFLPDISSSNFSLVCCDNNMNASEVFKSIGTEILRNHAEICGDNVVKRIAFGDETTFMAHPWSALLLYNTTQRFHCGGTLITNYYVLTAAHCAVQHYYPLIAVRLREHNITSEVDCALDDGGFEHCYPGVVDVNIEKIIIHPEFSIETYAHDIALLRLGDFIKYERSIRPICLPEYQNQEFDADYGIIAGWGATEKAKYSDVLLQTTIPIYISESCRNAYGKLATIDDFKFCAGGINLSIPCQGDSGGPLMLRIEGFSKGRKLRYLQAGIISLGNENCNGNSSTPTILTKISTYMDWIAASIEL